ncbi:rhodanese-like domain-containing protein [Croceiramulus getboli]|nr:rhodanese-like domain-containing protein [Flavobacteriaceae bacterium YJPT1-3]
MRNSLVLFLLCCAFPVLGQQPLSELLKQYNTRSIPYISPAELRMNQEQTLILDAREREEYEVSHIPGAIYIGYSDFDEQELQIADSATRTPVVVYCSLGIRSEKIAERLQKMGFSTIKNLYGGIFEWVNQGYPVATMDNRPTQRVHAYSKHWSQWLKAGEAVYKN